MKRFETLASARTSDGLALTFHRREDDYFLLLEGEELMSTRRNRSESALAELASRHLEGVARPVILIGGLGLGFTLRAALERLPAGGRLVVCELFAAVVDWNRKYLDESAAALADPRVAVVTRDVGAVIAGASAQFDAVLLDVDNGPSAWCLESNERLYGRRGLAAMRRSLKPGGILGIWSAYADPRFERLLGASGFRAWSESVRARGRKGSRHTIFFATPERDRLARRS